MGYIREILRSGVEENDEAILSNVHRIIHFLKM
jgi:hypothetical protein